MRPLALLLLAALAGCTAADAPPAPAPDSTEAPVDFPEDTAASAPLRPGQSLDSLRATHENARLARAALEPAPRSRTAGTARFSRLGEAVYVEVDLTGLSETPHALHIHTNGDCEAPGPLFNPDAVPLGEPFAQVERRPVGALGNVTGRDDGTVHYERVDPVVALGGPRSIIGRTLVVHAGQDDFHTEPDGGAGDVISCGVILP